jgi:hypothetical protein
MTEEEFGLLTLAEKWEHVTSVMDYIIKTDQSYVTAQKGFDMRRRLNPHHPKSQVKQETKLFDQEQRNLRIDQYQRWAHIKNLYAAHRDEMANTLEVEKYAEYKTILEKIFTMELDDALRATLETDT